MSIEQPGLGGEGEPKGEEQESFEAWQARQSKLSEVNPGEVESDPMALTEEEIAGLLEWNLAKNPPTPEILNDLPEKIRELNEKFDSFERTHSLEKLNEIVAISPELADLMVKSRDLIASQRFEEVEARVAKFSSEEGEKYRIREAARGDLDIIKHLMNAAEKGSTNLSTDTREKAELEKLKIRYRTIARAVGIMSGNIIYHDR